MTGCSWSYLWERDAIWHAPLVLVLLLKWQEKQTKGAKPFDPLPVVPDSDVDNM